MRSLTCALLAFVALVGTPATSPAAFGLTVVGLPATFQPGGDLSFDIRLTGPVTFDSYQVTLQLTALSAPTNTFQFLLDNDPAATLTVTQSAGYFAPASLNFFAGTTPLAPNSYELTVTDSGLQTLGIAATDNLLFRATVRTTAGFSGPLNLRFSTRPDQLFLLNDNPDPPTNVAGYDDLVTALNASPGFTADGGAGGAVATPVPPTLVVAVVAGVGLLGAGRRRQGGPARRHLRS